MGLPVAVTASLMLSSMLGLKFEAMSDGKWNHHFYIEPIRPSHMKPMRPVPMTSTTTNKPLPTHDDTHTNSPTTTLANNAAITESTMMGIISNSSSEKPVASDQIGSLEISSTPGVLCGPANCRDGEICVSWVKVRNETTRKSRESPLMSHQCLEDDGKHYTKMDPVGIQLCDVGLIPRIIKKDQSCLRENPPCPLVWMFECISEADAGSGAKLHSCKVKKCPGACTEVINCELDPPCFTVAECTSGGRVMRVSL